jgi:tetratricopeptide (TPR) repeat protein
MNLSAAKPDPLNSTEHSVNCGTPSRPRAFLSEAPEGTLELARTCFPQFDWERQSIARATFESAPRRAKLRPFAVHAKKTSSWFDSLGSDDCLVFWGDNAAARVSECPTLRARILRLDPSPFGLAAPANALSSDAMSLMLRPIDSGGPLDGLGKDAGFPDFALALDTKEPPARSGIGVIGDLGTALHARQLFPNQRIFALIAPVPRFADLVALADQNVRTLREGSVAAVLANAERIVTNTLDVALAAHAMALPVTVVGAAETAFRIVCELTAEGAGTCCVDLDARPVYCGFADRSTLAHISPCALTVSWRARAGSPEAPLAENEALPIQKNTAIVVGQPGRTIKPLARLFGKDAWQKPPQVSVADMQSVAERFAQSQLTVYAREETVTDWCHARLGCACRIVDRVPIDYPLMLTTTDVHIPAFGVHRVSSDGTATSFALAEDIAALTPFQRARYRDIGARLRPSLRRLQTARRLARFNKVEMGRRIGPLGSPRILVLGTEEDVPYFLDTNPKRVTDLDVIKAALAANPDARVLYQPQKKGLKNTAHIKAVKALGMRVQVIEAPFGINEYAHLVKEVHTVDSMLGPFAIAAGLDVVVYGEPPYARLGVTRDIDLNGDIRLPAVAEPLDADTFLGWYMTECIRFADPLSGEPIDIATFLADWTPYLGELNDQISDRLVARAADPATPPGDVQQYLRALTAHAKTAHIDRLIEARDPADLIAQSTGLATDFAIAAAQRGDWRDAVTRAFQIWQRHGAAFQAKLFTLLTQLRQYLDQPSETCEFNHFVLGTFRLMSNAVMQELGDAFLAKRFFESALTFYRSCQPSKALSAARARCLIGLGDRASAEELIGKLLDQKENAAVIEDLRLELHERFGEIDASIAIVERRVAKAASDFAQKLRLANLYRQGGRFAEAVELLLPLVRSNQGSASVRSLAQVYIAQMDTPRARGLLRSQLQMHPTDALAWKLLAETYAFDNDLEQACNCLYMTLTLSPLDIAAHTQLTELQAEHARQTGTRAGAWTETFDAFLSDVDQPSVETLLARGRSRLQLHDFECIKANCLEAMRLFPGDIPSHSWYAHALAWEMTEKSPEIVAEIRRHYGIALARDCDNNTRTILDALRSLAKIGDLESIRGLVREYRFSLYVGDRENLVIPRYSAALALGDFREAFVAMRSFARTRTLRRHAKSIRLALSLDEVQPRQNVLLLSEGGVGDEIRFSTLYPELARHLRFATISVDERLLALFKRSYPMVKRFVPLPRYHRKRLNRDHLASIGSLPERDLAPFADDTVWKAAMEADVVLPVACTLADLRATEDAFKTGRKVRLVPRDDLVARWRERLRPYADRLIVGATWTSMFREYQRVENYLSREEMAPLFTTPGAVFINFQYENVDDELAWAREALGIEIVDFPELDKRDDFEGLAALIANLDLFVGTGTTTTEFAALVGCPTIYASPACLNAYRNRDYSEADLYFDTMKMIRPIPATQRAEMMARICELVREAIARKQAGQVALYAIDSGGIEQQSAVVDRRSRTGMKIALAANA